MPSPTTPNMSLYQPTLGVTGWQQAAQELDANASTLDSHDHSSGRGVQIGVAGLNIQGDLALNNNNLTTIRALRLSALSLGSLTASDNAALAVSGVDLYYRDGNGNNVRLTQSGSIVGTAGSISGLTSPASASYIAGSGTFVWQSAVSTAAAMDMGPITLRYVAASANGITITPPAGLGANYTLTLPSGVPSSNNALTLTSTSGNQTYLPLGSANQVLVVNGAGTAVGYGTVQSSALASNLNLPGKAVQENGNNVVVSNTNATNSLAMIRGHVSVAGSADAGEGFSSSKFGTGIYDITFTTPFNDTPVVTFGSQSAVLVTIATLSSSAMRVTTYNLSVSPQNADFYFIAIGQRA